ncbi:hypothetical protein DPV78_000259 [Talaromyces pinophilus]|nr:hypothetical protein DPV78_000259 [Talaromyces pinophilus]
MQLPIILLEIINKFAKKYLGAFRAPNLRSINNLYYLFIGKGRQQLPLLLKLEIANYYIFCYIEAKCGKVTINLKLPITRAMLTKEITGFPWAVFTHQFWYGGGIIMNASGKYLLVPLCIPAMGLIYMTFLNHYLLRWVDVDMQALMQGLKPDLELMRAVTLCKLMDEQKASMENKLELIKAIKK